MWKGFHKLDCYFKNKNVRNKIESRVKGFVIVVRLFTEKKRKSVTEPSNLRSKEVEREFLIRTFKGFNLWSPIFLNTFLADIDKEEKDFVVNLNILNIFFHKFDQSLGVSSVIQFFKKFKEKDEEEFFKLIKKVEIPTYIIEKLNHSKLKKTDYSFEIYHKQIIELLKEEENRRKKLQKRCRKLISELFKVYDELGVYEVFPPFNLIKGGEKGKIALPKTKIKTKQDLLDIVKKIRKEVDDEWKDKGNFK